VISNAGAKEGARVAAQFEQIRAMFQSAFPHIRVDSGKPTIIFALKNEDSLKLFLPSYGLNNKEKHLAGLYQPGTSKNYALVRTDITGSGANPYHSLYHEYTHYLLRVNFVVCRYGLTKVWQNSMATQRSRGSRSFLEWPIPISCESYNAPQ